MIIIPDFLTHKTKTSSLLISAFSGALSEKKKLYILLQGKNRKVSLGNHSMLYFYLDLLFSILFLFLGMILSTYLDFTNVFYFRHV